MANKMQLDELEVCIQLIQVSNPELKKASYIALKEEIEKEFKCVVDLDDIYLLHEPTIQQDEQAAREYYGTMFNLGYSEYI